MPQKTPIFAPPAGTGFLPTRDPHLAQPHHFSASKQGFLHTALAIDFPVTAVPCPIP
jgi:hypothetical protein